MNLPSRPFFAVLAPVACALMLGGMAAQKGTYLEPEAFNAYHAAVAGRVDALPMGVGRWMGRTEEIPAPALKLLKPNAIRAIRFTDTGVDYLYDPRTVSFVVVQCRQSQDMVGHYPPRCYPSLGWELVADRPRDWLVGEATLGGTEYEFVKRDGDRETRKIVYNFMVVAGEGVTRDIQGVQDAAEDYQQRYYGAAQFQLVFPDRLCRQATTKERDEIFATLLAPSVPLVETIAAGDLTGGAAE